MAHFVEEWTAHRRELTAGFAWRDHRFLLVAVDESRASASGCSVDALTSELRELEGELGLELLDASPVWFRDAEGRVRSVSRDEFRKLAAEGRVGPETHVFDLAVTRLADLRSGRWELPASSSWHSRLIDSEP